MTNNENKAKVFHQPLQYVENNDSFYVIERLSYQQSVMIEDFQIFSRDCMTYQLVIDRKHYLQSTFDYHQHGIYSS